MILLAKDDVGYQQPLALTTAAHLDGYYYKPRIDKELLASTRRGSSAPRPASAGRS